MEKDQENELLNKWLSRELSDEEARSALGDDDFLKYQQIVAEVDRWVPDNDPVIFDSSLVTSTEKETPVRKLNFTTYLSIAASVALLLVATIWFVALGDKNSYETTAEAKEFLLPDGSSKVTLAPFSKVAWEGKDWESGRRSLTLSGKALFDVEKGGAFEVFTPIGNVEVLGTVFEVQEFAEGMSVACYEGRVRATALDDQAVIVSAGEGTLYYEGVWENKMSLSDQVPSWLANESKFVNAPLVQVIRTLEKQYKIKIERGRTNMDRRFTGTFPNNDLNTALKIVFAPFGITYEIDGEIVSLKE
ncbi:MAG: FecR domain-containing protein [Cyclobacteriaceae bacterium]